MAKEGSVAPKERVNIVYKPTSGAQEEVELPLKILALGDFTGKPDDRTLEDRKPVNIDKDNFNDVMAAQGLGVSISVPDRLSGQEGAEMSMELDFKSMSDFTPEGVAAKVPELAKLMELRNALIALRSPLGNIPNFRKRLEAILKSEDGRAQLMKELGLDSSGQQEGQD